MYLLSIFAIKKMKRIFFAATACCAILLCQSQNEKDGLVQWLSFKEAQEKNKTIPKPFLVDIYTDWCGWCKVMMKTTYSNPNIAGYINTYFYPIKFNAETKDTIEFDGQKYVSTNPAHPKAAHQLAVKFLGNNLAYPSTVFISSDLKTTFLSQGYLKEQDIEPFLVFMVENVFRTSPFNVFQQLFKDAFYNQSLKKRVSVLSLQEAEKQKGKKKTVVFFYTNFCNSCKVTTQAVIHDSLVADVLNKYYNTVVLNAEEDTIVFHHQKYTKQLINGYPFNTAVLFITANKFSLPCFAILDENMQAIETIGLFQTPESLYHILKYFGENIYQKMRWDEYVQSQQSKQATEVPENKDKAGKNTPVKAKQKK
ncbi:MAG: DUF255 domain-containing protein [Bacteroidetes bacterium]|nr:MAG: DUF255 domain-containing protein [Bacteroidota bacterium]